MAVDIPRDNARRARIATTTRPRASGSGPITQTHSPPATASTCAYTRAYSPPTTRASAQSTSIFTMSDRLRRHAGARRCASADAKDRVNQGATHGDRSAQRRRLRRLAAVSTSSRDRRTTRHGGASFAVRSKQVRRARDARASSPSARRPKQARHRERSSRSGGIGKAIEAAELSPARPGDIDIAACSASAPTPIRRWPSTAPAALYMAWAERGFAARSPIPVTATRAS